MSDRTSSPNRFPRRRTARRRGEEALVRDAERLHDPLHIDRAGRGGHVVVPSGTYEYNADGEPIPGTYQEIDHEPQRIILDSLTAPINGLYGIEDETGNISYWNSGDLFGAIDVALFIIVIGGFLGVTMKTGAINAGIASLVRALKGREKLMIPVLMGVFALGGTTLWHG